MTLEASIDEEIKNVCPIDGISFGDINDKSTWKIHFSHDANGEQIRNAQKVLEAFEWDEKRKEKSKKRERDARFSDDLIYREGFLNYRNRIPSASFTDYLDYLESIRI